MKSPELVRACYRILRKGVAMRPAAGSLLRALFGVTATALLAGPAGATGFSLHIAADG